MSLVTKLSSLQTRIAELQKEEQELSARIAAGYVDPDLVQPGRQVRFEYGRPAKEYAGTVTGRKEAEGKGRPAQVAILVGEGFDQQVIKVHPNAVKEFTDLGAVIREGSGTAPETAPETAPDLFPQE